MSAGWWRQVLAEQEAQWFLWTPVALTLGIWSYFALAIEPSDWVFAGVSALALAIAALGKRGPLSVAIVLVLAGFILAKARTEWVRTPVITAPTGVVAIQGEIMDIQRKSNRRSLILKVESIEGFRPEKTPVRLRLSLPSKSPNLQAGQSIKAKAMLFPLPTPVSPGAHDFGQVMWFAGIGGTGRITGDVQAGATGPAFASWIQSLRDVIGERIRAVLPGANGAFGEAIITGERGTIPTDINESLQVSGLAHILSISGLHMSLVAGSVFWLVRAVLALSPALALSFPIKKWAAAAALAAGFFYMILAGSAVATQRSYIMLAVMFLAILVDRPALSMRNLAVAALIVLILEPEAALTASFQMSFMAVMGLIALHEAWSVWRLSRIERAQRRGIAFRVLQWLLLMFFAAGATTLAAGAFSSIPAAYHFGRVSPLSLVANLLALPVVSLVVMPSALVSVLLMPLGLEKLPVWLMGEGLSLVLRVSDWVAHLPLARTIVPTPPLVSILLLSAGAVWLCLWRGRLRAAGIAVMFGGLLLSKAQVPPDILIERTAANVAIRTETGELAFADPRRARFAAERWLAGNGEDLTLKGAQQRQGWSCAAGICRAELKGRKLAFVREGAKLHGVCDELNVLIADFPLRGLCRGVPLRIDRFDVWRHGAHAVYLGAETVVTTVRGEQGIRPWTFMPTPRARTADRR